MSVSARLLATAAISALVAAPAYAADAPAADGQTLSKADIIVTGARSKQAGLNESRPRAGLTSRFAKLRNR